MPVADHVASFRNGSQVMVRGLPLGDRLGYCRGARVQVTDPNGNITNEPWVFTVPNSEHASLSCANPPPPAWIQPGVLIRIEVDSPIDMTEPAGTVAITPPRETTEVLLLASTSESSHLTLPPHVVYAVDVGAPGAGLAWARTEPHSEKNVYGSMNFRHFLDLIVKDLQSGLPVALGFEAPMFLPVTSDLNELTRSRTAEPMAWSCHSGACVATVAIPLMSFTLRHIRSHVEPNPCVKLDPADWLATRSYRPQLFLWEAFVTGIAHAREPNEAGLEVHLVDAATAVVAFTQWEANSPRRQSDVTARNPISTVGAAVLWSGLDDDLQLLHQQTLVLRPTQLLGAGIMEFQPPAA